MREKYIKSKRNTLIPVTIETASSKGALLILVHSFMSDRSENERFDKVSEALKKANVYSIAMDLPGNNQSQETMLEYTIKNCLNDIESCYQYMINNYDIDQNRIGIVGYSLGGRLASLFTQLHPRVNCLVLWAAACHNGFEDGKFIKQDVALLKQEALDNGFCNFYDVYGQQYIKLSNAFLDEMESYKPLTSLNNYQGKALIIQGNKDTTIDVNNGQLIYDNLLKATSRQLVVMNGADHGFGLWDGRVEDSDKLVELTVNFLEKNM